MTRINTNIAAITAQGHLTRANGDLNSTLQRLSSGLRINRGADDPAGLIASETLRSEMKGIQQAMDNSQRASNVIATAEGALNEVSSLLMSIKELTVEAANTGALSAEEIEANQLQVDSAIDSITRISNATTFAGLNLLNGSLGYVTSGVATSAIGALDIYSAKMGTQSYIGVQVSGVRAAERGAVSWRPPAGSISASVVVEIASNRGVEVFNFVSGFSPTNLVSAINAVTDVTGVSALLYNSSVASSGVTFRSVDYGSDSFVSVRTLPTSKGGFPVENASGTVLQRDNGDDAVAVVNGTTVTGRGTELTLNTTMLDLRMKVDNTFGSGNASSFSITGGGAMFQLGPHINSAEQVSIGVQSIAASRLGTTATGFLNEVATGGACSLVAGKSSAASEIIDEAIMQIAVLRGRLGAFEKNTLDTNMNSLGITLENVTASESSIRDADFAVETAALTRSQILVSAGTSVLSIANQTPQSVLSLLQ